jgi:hypothetical protein
LSVVSREPISFLAGSKSHELFHSQRFHCQKTNE